MLPPDALRELLRSQSGCADFCRVLKPVAIGGSLCDSNARGSSSTSAPAPRAT
jgi:hypothetical protein